MNIYNKAKAIEHSTEIIYEHLQRGDIIPVAYTGSNKDILGLSGYAQPYFIEKKWGHEKIFQNHKLYCCKELYIKPNCSCSYHLHMEKHETLTVTKGTLYVDTLIDKTKKTFIVESGSSFVVAPGLIHSLRATKEGVTLIESSTPSFDTDSIRISDGD